MSNDDPAQKKTSADAPERRDFAANEYHDAVIEEVPRDEGYSEFRCIPAHWLPSRKYPQDLYVAEGLSALMGVDKDPDFWSASDAAMRARAAFPSELDERELSIYATRRSNDYNRSTPWAARRVALSLEREWQGFEDPHVHPFANLPDTSTDGLFGKYGMTATILRSDKRRVVTGFEIRDSQFTPTTPEPWHGGPGTWVSWQTLSNWTAIPRRQDVLAHLKEAAAEGRLLLFLSHRWESPTNPDPEGKQLTAIRTGLTIALGAALANPNDPHSTASGLPDALRVYLKQFHTSAFQNPDLQAWGAAVATLAKECTEEPEFWRVAADLDHSFAVEDTLESVRRHVLLWYDYVSMFQRPRTEYEEEVFRDELCVLNDIQAGALTVVLADDEEYMSRAWCFLEIAGGIGHAIAELTPSWAQRFRVHSSANRWMHISDQFVGAVKAWGPQVMQSCGLTATEQEDLPVIGQLASQLQLLGSLETDGMDLIGGSIPLPFIRGKGWVIAQNSSRRATTAQLEPLPNFGQVPSADTLREAADECAFADALSGACGMWIYTTQRMLSLAWASRRREIFDWLKSTLQGQGLASACSTWADSRCLTEDGIGWTRYIPSDVNTLVIVTQTDIPDICLLYDFVVNCHLSAGCTVITAAPESGTLTMLAPERDCHRHTIDANVLVAPRIRRSTAYASYLLCSKNATKRSLKIAATLRLDPSELNNLEATFNDDQIRDLSMKRILLEAECRGTAACWEQLLDHGLNLKDWPTAEHGHRQMDIVREILKTLHKFTDNPLLRRRLLYEILEHETTKNQPLPDDLPQKVIEIVQYLTQS